jgi:hypothetical protein
VTRALLDSIEPSVLIVDLGEVVSALEQVVDRSLIIVKYAIIYTRIIGCFAKDGLSMLHPLVELLRAYLQSAS